MKYSSHHPSAIIDPDLISTIRKASREAEDLRRLHNDQLGVISKEKWFNMFVPHEFGGLGLSLPEILKIEECLSWADGSTAWAVTLCSGAGWFIGFLDPCIVAEIFTNDSVCIAGSGALTGIAEVTPDGYEINGIWNYASGALHATAFTVNCYLKKDNQQLYTVDGSPRVSSFILKKNEVKIQQTWNSMGMIATGSHSFEVHNLRVQSNRCFTIHPSKAVLKNAIYHYPFLQLAETTLVVNLSGMAIRFMELAELIFIEKLKNKSAKTADLANLLAKTQQKMMASRQQFFDRATESWNELLLRNSLSEKSQIEVSIASHTLAKNAREVVTTLYSHCGLIAADMTTELNRVWRNFHTGSQHSLFRNTMEG